MESNLAPDEQKGPLPNGNGPFQIEKILLSTEIRCHNRATTIIGAMQVVRMMISVGEDVEHGNDFR